MIGKKRKKRCCAVCGDRSQVNVSQLFRVFDTGRSYSVCLLCREGKKVDAESVKNYPDGDITDA